MEQFLYLLLINLALVSSQKLPDYIQICHLSDPDLNGCVTKSVESLRPKLISGMPELNVPSIEPMEISELVATQGTGLKVVTKNLKVYGGSNFTILSLNVDMKTKKISFNLAFEDLHIEGDYEVDGKIITIPIKGKGDLKADARDIKANVVMQGVMETKGGDEYMKFSGMTMEFTVGKGKVQLGNLFGGDKLLGDVVNAAINMNFQFFMKELTPIIVETLTDFVLKSANNIVDSVPYKVAFPE